MRKSLEKVFDIIGEILAVLALILYVFLAINAHIYDRHIPLIEKMLEQPVYDAPEFVMDKSVKDFYAFNTTHFKLENYRYNDFEVKPEVAV